MTSTIQFSLTTIAMRSRRCSAAAGAETAAQTKVCSRARNDAVASTVGRRSMKRVSLTMTSCSAPSTQLSFGELVVMDPVVMMMTSPPPLQTMVATKQLVWYCEPNFNPRSCARNRSPRARPMCCSQSSRDRYRSHRSHLLTSALVMNDTTLTSAHWPLVELSMYSSVVIHMPL